MTARCQLLKHRDLWLSLFPPRCPYSVWTQLCYFCLSGTNAPLTESQLYNFYENQVFWRSVISTGNFHKINAFWYLNDAVSLSKITANYVFKKRSISKHSLICSNSWTVVLKKRRWISELALGSINLGIVSGSWSIKFGDKVAYASTLADGVYEAAQHHHSSEEGWNWTENKNCLSDRRSWYH